MNTYKFVRDSIYSLSIQKGASHRSATNAADSGFEMYKQNKFDKAKKLIDEKVKEAVKQTKMEGTLL